MSFWMPSAKQIIPVSNTNTKHKYGFVLVFKLMFAYAFIQP